MVKRCSHVRCKKPVRTESSVQYDFDNFDVDDDEPQVNENVHNSGYGAHHHFALPQRNTTHNAPAPGWLIGSIERFPKADIGYNLPYIFEKQPDSCNQNQDEYDVCDAHANLRFSGLLPIVSEGFQYRVWIAEPCFLFYRRKLK